MMLRSGIVAALLLTPSRSRAQWKDEAGAGLLITSGYSESESFNGKFLLDGTRSPWKNRFSATAINQGDEDGRTAEGYTVGDRLDCNPDVPEDTQKIDTFAAVNRS